MSIEDRNRIIELERRVQLLEQAMERQVARLMEGFAPPAQPVLTQQDARRKNARG